MCFETLNTVGLGLEIRYLLLTVSSSHDSYQISGDAGEAESGERASEPKGLVILNFHISIEFTRIIVVYFVLLCKVRS